MSTLCSSLGACSSFGRLRDVAQTAGLQNAVPWLSSWLMIIVTKKRVFLTMKYGDQISEYD